MKFRGHARRRTAYGPAVELEGGSPKRRVLALRTLFSDGQPLADFDPRPIGGFFSSAVFFHRQIFFIGGFFSSAVRRRVCPEKLPKNKQTCVWCTSVHASIHTPLLCAWLYMWYNSGHCGAQYLTAQHHTAPHRHRAAPKQHHTAPPRAHRHAHTCTHAHTNRSTRLSQ